MCCASLLSRVDVGRGAAAGHAVEALEAGRPQHASGAAAVARGEVQRDAEAPTGVHVAHLERGAWHGAGGMKVRTWLEDEAEHRIGAWERAREQRHHRSPVGSAEADQLM